MASYNVLLKPSIAKDLRGFPRAVIQRILNRIESLADNPLPRHSVKLGGAEYLFRVRVGDYRIVYRVDSEQKAVIIQYVRHRGKAYRD